MNKKQIINCIKAVIRLIKLEYKDLYVDYVTHQDCYEIWHNSEDLEFKNPDFKKFTGSLLYDFFLSRNITNVFINYNYELSKITSLS